MIMQDVDSSNVEAVGFDEENFILRVRYHGGRTYDYSGVSPETYENLLAAPSVGSFMASVIKPTYQFEQIS